MDIKEYRAYKKLQQVKLEREESKFRDICLKCLRAKKNCFCKTITPINTKTHFVLLMHPKEAKKNKTGTGRLTHICLSNSKIITGESFDQSAELQNLLQDQKYYPMILYPGEDAHNISDYPLKENLLGSKELLVLVIDGTWPCAKSMMRESKSLHHLPRISFNPTETSAFIIRQQPAKYCLSTIESIYQLIGGLEKWGHEKLNGGSVELTKALKTLVDFQLRCANDPSLKGYRRKSYTTPDNRPTSKKWDGRKICFQEKNYKHMKRNKK